MCAIHRMEKEENKKEKKIKVYENKREKKI